MGNQLGTLVTPVVASAPSGVKGQVYFDDTTKKLMYHNGTTWVDPSAGGGGGSPGGSSGEVQYNNAGSFAGAANVEIHGGDLKLTKNDTPTLPAADELKVFARSIAGRMMTSQVGPSGLDTALQPLLARNKVAFWNPQGNSTTLPGVFGFSSPTAVGTATARNVAATNVATRMKRLGYVSAATAGSIAEARITTAQYTTGNGSGLGGFLFITRFVPSNAAAVSGERFFIGMRESTSAGTNVEQDTLINQLGIAQISSDDTQFYFVYGGTSAQTRIACGTTVGAPNTLTTNAYELAIWCPPSTSGIATMQLMNVATGVTVSQTVSGTAAVVPTSSVLLAFRAFKCNNATAAAVAFDLSSIYLETDQ